MIGQDAAIGRAAGVEPMSILIVLGGIAAAYLSIGGLIYSFVPTPRKLSDEPARHS